MAPPKLKLVSARLLSGCVIRSGSWRLEERRCSARGAPQVRHPAAGRPHVVPGGAVSRSFDHARPLRAAGRRS